jgi:hypothetical protein
VQNLYVLIPLASYLEYRGKGKVIPVQAVEAIRVVRGSDSRILDIRLTDGGKVVSPMRRPLFTPRKVPSTHFC